MLDEASITSYVTSTFEGASGTVNLGYTFFFHRGDHMHAFATIASNGNGYEQIRPMLAEVYEVAVTKYNKRKRRTWTERRGQNP